MKILATGVVAAIAVAALPASAYAYAPTDTPAVPTITEIALAIDDATVSPGSPCVNIPIALSYVTNGNYVYEVDVYVTRGTLPSDTTATATQLTAPGTTMGGVLSGTLSYCPSTQGIGKLDAGPSVIHYAQPSEVGQTTVTSDTVAQFDVQQASTATLTAKRPSKKKVVLHATETYYDYKNGALHPTHGQVAHLQRFHVSKKKYVNVAHAKPKAKKGYASFTVKSKKPHNYRVVFASSTTIAKAVSDVVNT